MQSYNDNINVNNNANDQADNGSNKIDNLFCRNESIEKIKNRLLNQLPTVLQSLLPEGKIYNNQFHIGNISGYPGDSLKIELNGNKAGVWQDFATGERGDIFDLWGAVKGINTRNEFPRLLEDIKNWLGDYSPSRGLTPDKSAAERTRKIANNDNLSNPSAEWSYTDVHGKIKAKKLRYDLEDGTKRYLPWDEVLKAYKMPKIRPLYNIPGIVKSDRVILVEGEKCAQALIDIGICATTAMGGANTDIDKTNWLPLKEKEVIIWPDNDEPGKKYAQSAYEKLIMIGAQSVKIIDIPNDKQDKWDSADAIEEGIDVKGFIKQAKFIDTRINDNDYIERVYDTDLIDTPPPMEWIIPGWMPKGEVGAIYGDGGLGKSLLVQQLMVALATGNEWLGFKREPIKVYGVICEDKKDEFHRRQHRIYKKLGIAQSDIKRNMVLIPRKGKDNTLMRFDKEERTKLSRFFSNLLVDIKKFQPELVVLDTLADTFGGNENIRSQARQFIQSCCGRIAEETGATVLLCAHPSEAGLSKKSGTGGSTAWHNTLRFRWFIDKLEGIEFTANMRTLTLMKSNYSPCDAKFILKIEKDGIFNIVDDFKILSAAEKHSNKLEDLRDAKSNYILNLIYDEASVGRAYTMSSFSETFQNTGKPNLGSKRTLQNELNSLASKKYIKFFQNWKDFGLQKLKKNDAGYMCIGNMSLKVKEKGVILVNATHYKCPLSGNIIEITNN